MCDFTDAPGGREAAMVAIANPDPDSPSRDGWCDPCIEPLIRALNTNGLRTIASCCGHFNHAGWVMLADGRTLAVFPNHDEAMRINGMTSAFRLSTHSDKNVSCNCEPMDDERLERIRKRAEWAVLNATGVTKVFQHGTDVLDLLAERNRLLAEKRWFERKAREAGTTAWKLDLGRKRVLQIRTARNIVNQLADYYSALIPSDKWARVRQMSNDRLDTFVQSLLAERFTGKGADGDA